MRDWNTKWDGWKVGHFATLQTENMEGTTQETFKKIQKLQRELKVGQETGPVWCHSGWESVDTPWFDVITIFKPQYDNTAIL